ncbi:hypothetical protein SS1G_04904 [Sclerotinia sclerotiorum 1980 UF-70]|uniref:C2H2-type domain-containing protein n=2 Tax=Sclerotinia sclerotiorum (strain ATCC 18683 / 1980 / Ss-1) TaxID=665079 RepID=A7EHW2_SCLS1|nr:hypothetical protein SS1G_04904 [Sclerotinia sclerotiorum 1980 UF-70]APA11497.1 hypothetical protein sscle_08g062670 [Sclerotinia sclerotiorum 1980 UF-70]EDO02428.1 hypothetical protein SS1G_04904 [Sclerotinia sclerotiorum 1980 UF-70]
MNTRQHDTPGSRPTRVQKTPRIYTCSVCQRQFKRSEHCSRHERGHTQEKPFPCRLCGRRYARKDVVIRHEKSFHRLENPRRQQPPPPLQPSSPDLDADSEPFTDSIIVNTHNHRTEPQLPMPMKLEHHETPEMQSTLDPLLREHDAQLAGHSSSSGPHMNGHGATNHGFQQYQNGFIDPALDISDLFGPSPNLIART